MGEKPSPFEKTAKKIWLEQGFKGHIRETRLRNLLHVELEMVQSLEEEEASRIGMHRTVCGLQ